jgi:hypothetical protein
VRDPPASIRGLSDTRTRSPGAATTTSAPVPGSVSDTGAAGSGVSRTDRRVIASGEAPTGPVNHAAAAGLDGLPPAVTSAHLPPGTSPAKTTRRRCDAPVQEPSPTAARKSASPASEPTVGDPYTPAGGGVPGARGRSGIRTASTAAAAAAVVSSRRRCRRARWAESTAAAIASAAVAGSGRPAASRASRSRRSGAGRSGSGAIPGRRNSSAAPSRSHRWVSSRRATSSRSPATAASVPAATLGGNPAIRCTTTAARASSGSARNASASAVSSSAGAAAGSDTITCSAAHPGRRTARRARARSAPSGSSSACGALRATARSRTAASGSSVSRTAAGVTRGSRRVTASPVDSAPGPAPRPRIRRSLRRRNCPPGARRPGLSCTTSRDELAAEDAETPRIPRPVWSFPATPGRRGRRRCGRARRPPARGVLRLGAGGRGRSAAARRATGPWAGGTMRSWSPCQTATGRSMSETRKPQSRVKARSSSRQPATPCDTAPRIDVAR